MTVSTEVNHNEYTGNGVTTTFPYTFRILDKGNLFVQTMDASGNIRTLLVDTDYTVTGVDSYSGGNIVLPSALGSGWRISIDRELEKDGYDVSGAAAELSALVNYASSTRVSLADVRTHLEYCADVLERQIR